VRECFHTIRIAREASLNSQAQASTPTL
jgi:hypothetical protein